MTTEYFFVAGGGGAAAGDELGQLPTFSYRMWLLLSEMRDSVFSKLLHGVHDYNFSTDLHSFFFLADLSTPLIP